MKIFKPAIFGSVLSAFLASTANAHTKPIVIENYLYYPTRVTSVSLVVIPGHTWPWSYKLSIAGWHPPYGIAPEQTVPFPFDPPCNRTALFTFEGHAPVTTPVNVCTTNHIDIRHATPGAGVKAPIKFTFE